MLVAYGPDNRPIAAYEAPLEQLQTWSREQALHCPNCRGALHVRGGPEKRMQLHFAHRKGECAWSTEAESVQHVRGKMVLAQWLREQFPEASITLEERLPEPNRIADIFVTHADGRRWAVEFQCAPLDLDEWRHRHIAYHKVNIRDTWIIGKNRLAKQEAFIEAILASAHEIMFLDPLITPPRAWLRWVVTNSTMRTWQHETGWRPAFEGWVGRLGYGVTMLCHLQELRIGEQGVFQHPSRSSLETRTQLLYTMKDAQNLDESTLKDYLQPILGEETMDVVILPLMRAYLRDPGLLRRYNYGRGCSDQPLSDLDKQRIGQAHAWLERLALQGFPLVALQELAKAIPFVGPYAAFAGYMEMLIALSRRYEV